MEDELLRLARENNEMLRELIGYKRLIESKSYQDNETAREFLINLLSDMLTNNMPNNQNRTRLG